MFSFSLMLFSWNSNEINQQHSQSSVSFTSIFKCCILKILTAWASAEILNFPGGQRQHIAYPFQVADDEKQMTFINALPFLHHKEKAPCYGNSGKKCASLTVIARYITIILNKVHLFAIAGRYYVYFYELRPSLILRHVSFFALLVFCFHTLSLACFHTSVWPSFY